MSQGIIVVTFQLSTQEFLEMQRELNQDRISYLLDNTGSCGRKEPQKLRRELYKACQEMEVLLEECDRLSRENRKLKAQGHQP